MDEVMRQNLYLCAILILGMVSCSYWNEQDSSDLKKYPELQPFMQELGEFKRGRLHLDMGILEAEFALSYSENILVKFDEIAELEGWDLVDEREDMRFYSRSFGDDKSWIDTLGFKIENNSEVALTWRRTKVSVTPSAAPD